MAVTPQFTASDVRKVLLEKKRRIEEALLSKLQSTGEQFITNARNNNTYKDHSGNLRSSIGYVILKNGEQVAITFPGTGEGSKIGEDVISKIAARYPVGFVLIVVAGMDYAAAVEALGFDVLTASGLKAESDLKKSLEKLRS